MEQEYTHEGEAVASEQSHRKHFFGDISLKLVLLLAFLTPIFVIPSAEFPFQFTKTALALLITLALLGLLVWRMVNEKKLEFFYSPLIISLFSLPVVYLIASIFSSQPLRSFFGYQLETDTFAFILFAAVLVGVVLSTLKKKTQVFTVLVSILISSWVVFLFQLIQVLFGAPLPLGVLGDPIVNLVGRWNDFGVFTGLIGALALFSLESFPLPKRGKYVVAATVVVSLFFLILVNLAEVWVLFGLASLTVLMLIFAKKHFSPESKIKVTPALVLAAIGFVASVFFIFFGGTVATQVQNTFQINALEVRPSTEGTLDVLSAVYEKSPILGSGPNTFGTEWLLYRPDGVLQTPFWNTNFGAGSGTIPTAFVTGGVLVALGWIMFTFMLLYTIFRALFTVPSDVGTRSYMLTALTALGSLYLILIHYVYAPSQSLTLLLFLFVALFIASLKDTRLMKPVSLSGIDSPRISFAMMLIGVVVGLVSLGVIYDTGKTYMSVVHYERAIALANTGDLDAAEASINSALDLSTQDRYYRTASLIQVARLNQIVRSGAGDEVAQTNFQNALAGAIQFSGFAIQSNPNQFDNWLTRALVYATVVPLNIDGAYENALTTLEEARTRSPKSPEVDLRLAEVHRANGNSELARSALAAALEKKPDYTVAILQKAQIELNEGELDDAIESVRGAVFFEPQNPVLLYQLGILFLQDENYTDAAAAFELALQSQPDYANAAFFLAQAYSFLDRLEDSLSLMEQLAELNPDNALVLDARDELRNGVNPFSGGGIESPVEDIVEVE